MRTKRIARLVDHEISRFPRRLSRGFTLKVSDPARHRRFSPFRFDSCCPPLFTRGRRPDLRHFRGSILGLSSTLSTLRDSIRILPRMTRARHGWLLLSPIEICIQNQSAGFIPAHMNQIMMKRAKRADVVGFVRTTVTNSNDVVVIDPPVIVATFPVMADMSTAPSISQVHRVSFARRQRSSL
jgi:hypothetical protein